MKLRRATNGGTQVERCGKPGMTHAIHKSRTANVPDAQRIRVSNSLGPRASVYSQGDA
jgi:hypothetical protein